MAARDLFSELDGSKSPVSPKKFVRLLRRKYPDYNKKKFGSYEEQDAEECWTRLVNTFLDSLLRAQNKSENPETVKRIFGIDIVGSLDVSVHSPETGNSSFEKASFNMFPCHISHEAETLLEALKIDLKDERDLFSACLELDSKQLKESRIDGLPRYLTIQFLRFDWNEKLKTNEKNKTRLDYPLELDVYDLCSDELRLKLEAPRKRLKENTAMNASKDEERESQQKQITGFYELISVLVHMGESGDHGHYVSYVKQEDGTWTEFNDKETTEQWEEGSVTEFNGGDNTAYVCMYKARLS